MLGEIGRWQPVLDTLSAVRLVIKHQAELRSDGGATQSGVLFFGGFSRLAGLFAPICF
jgi:hypothetical protein